MRWNVSLLVGSRLVMCGSSATSAAVIRSRNRRSVLRTRLRRQIPGCPSFNVECLIGTSEPQVHTIVSSTAWLSANRWQPGRADAQDVHTLPGPLPPISRLSPGIESDSIRRSAFAPCCLPERWLGEQARRETGAIVRPRYPDPPPLRSRQAELPLPGRRD